MKKIFISTALLFLITFAGTLEVFASIKQVETSQTETVLYQKRWKLAKINEKEIKDTKAFLVFDQKKKAFGGNTGCNAMGGNVSIEKDGLIDFKSIFSTKMACENMNEIEFSFVKNLESAISYEVFENKLYLYSECRIILEFEGVSKE